VNRPGHSEIASRPFRTCWALALLAAALLPAGCVQRRLTIRSNPPGALVYVDNYEIGTTPVSTDFIYYGTREIRLVRDGYQTLTIPQPIPPPWYQFYGVDFFAENVIPWEIRDQRVLDFQLVPQVIVPTDELLGRANALRQGMGIEGLAPVSSPLPAPTGPEIVPLPSVSPQPLPEFRLPR
jgi:hypothetical protein